MNYFCYSLNDIIEYFIIDYRSEVDIVDMIFEHYKYIKEIINNSNFGQLIITKPINYTFVNYKKYFIL